MFYIAYGANINPLFLRKRCPDAKYLEDGYLMGYKLTFRRCRGKSFVALEESENSSDQVQAILWWLSDSDVKALDQYVCSLGVFRKEDTTITCGRRIRKGFMYVMDGGEKSLPPQDHFDYIVRGYDLAGFDYSPLIEALRSIDPHRYDKVERSIREKMKLGPIV